MQHVSLAAFPERFCESNVALEYGAKQRLEEADRHRVLHQRSLVVDADVVLRKPHLNWLAERNVLLPDKIAQFRERLHRCQVEKAVALKAWRFLFRSLTEADGLRQLCLQLDNVRNVVSRHILACGNEKQRAEKNQSESDDGEHGVEQIQPDVADLGGTLGLPGDRVLVAAVVSEPAT